MLVGGASTETSQIKNTVVIIESMAMGKRTRIIFGKMTTAKEMDQRSENEGVRTKMTGKI